MSEFGIESTLEDVTLTKLQGAGLALWREKQQGRRAPARADFDPQEMKPWLHWVMLTEVHEGDPMRFRRRLVGTGITGIVGRDVTGKYFEDIYEGETLAGVSREYCRCATNWLPAHVQGQTPNRVGYSFDSLLLPLSADQQRVDMILSISEFTARY